ncbi:carcinine transporter [Caerostris darwini]|uniref:Carcinine transporter n=1 Tax=Caerostris darwini TaxID=1538125 RepID=A0AAV4T4M2_9ARAC|nr:carcinine transporter [Caerostris darwini]
MDLDEILHEVGDSGKYQNLMLWFVFLPAHLTFGCHAFSQLFMTWTPEHWCQIPELAAANLSDHLIRHLTIPPDLTPSGYSRCSMYKLDYSIHTQHNTIILKEPNTNWTNVTCHSGWIYNTSSNWDRDTVVTKSLALILVVYSPFSETLSRGPINVRIREEHLPEFCKQPFDLSLLESILKTSAANDCPRDEAKWS